MTTHKHTAGFEYLDGSRSWNNESEAKEMAGCIAEGGAIVAYVPHGATAKAALPLLLAAPSLLAALEALLRNRDAAEAYIRILEGKEEFDGAGNALPCDSPECEQARSALALVAGDGDCGSLHNYHTGEVIRPATKAEAEASRNAGPEGVIEAIVDGKTVSCYVAD